jgi:hypothetical protein
MRRAGCAHKMLKAGDVSRTLASFQPGHIIDPFARKLIIVWQPKALINGHDDAVLLALWPAALLPDVSFDIQVCQPKALVGIAHVLQSRMVHRALPFPAGKQGIPSLKGTLISIPPHGENILVKNQNTLAGTKVIKHLDHGGRIIQHAELAGQPLLFYVNSPQFGLHTL